MKKSKKVTIGILLFFIVIAVIIGGRSAIGNHFKKKFSKRPPPGVIVEVVKEKNFSQTIESYCTALSSQSVSFKIKKSVVFTCGSGVTACVLGLANSIISGKTPIIYDGSWSEWGKE